MELIDALPDTYLEVGVWTDNSGGHEQVKVVSWEVNDDGSMFPLILDCKGRLRRIADAERRDGQHYEVGEEGFVLPKDVTDPWDQL